VFSHVPIFCVQCVVRDLIFYHISIILFPMCHMHIFPPGHLSILCVQGVAWDLIFSDVPFLSRCNMRFDFLLC
jgi:hypothetical protein